MVSIKATDGPGVRVDRFLPNAIGVDMSVQIWYDGWRGQDRVLRYYGACRGCGRYTWGADDGENDPRGVLGDYATHALVASEYDMVGPDVALCAICANEYGPYKAVLDLAQRKLWKHPDDESGTDA